MKIAAIHSASEVSSRLADIDAADLAAARNDVASRPIRYPLGSGEAELVALLAGIKPMIRQTLQRHDVDRMRRVLGRLGLAVHVIDAADRPESILLAGRDAAALRDAARLEASGSPREYGFALGYPPCCSDAFAETPKPRRNADLHRRSLGGTRGTPHPRLNVLDLAIFHFIPWFPCSFRCPASVAFADSVATILATRYVDLMRPAEAYAPDAQPAVAQFVSRIDAALTTHRLFLFEEVQLSIAGRCEDGIVEIDTVRPTASDRPSRAPLDTDAADASARLLAVVRNAKTLSVRDGALVLDGVPRFRTPDALLVPFG